MEEYLSISINGGSVTIFLEVNVAIFPELLRLFDGRRQRHTGSHSLPTPSQTPPIPLSFIHHKEKWESVEKLKLGWKINLRIGNAKQENFVKIQVPWKATRHTQETTQQPPRIQESRRSNFSLSF